MTKCSMHKDDEDSMKIKRELDLNMNVQNWQENNAKRKHCSADYGLLCPLINDLSNQTQPGRPHEYQYFCNHSVLIRKVISATDDRLTLISTRFVFQKRTHVNSNGIRFPSTVSSAMTDTKNSTYPIPILVFFSYFGNSLKNHSATEPLAVFFSTKFTL